MRKLKFLRCFRDLLLFPLVIMLMLISGGKSQSRLALVIGNATYAPSVGSLNNPHIDATIVSDALKEAGFAVTQLKDATQIDLMKALERFILSAAELPKDSIAFIYYSGHGVARPNFDQNFIIPTDITDTSNDDFWYRAVKLDDIIDQMKRSAPHVASFIVFDACRDVLRLPFKSVSKGFVELKGRAGLFLGFSTSPGQVASDVGDEGGPYARALAAALKRPGIDHLEIFQSVKEKVYSSTNNRQVAWESNGLVSRIVLNRKARAEQQNVATKDPTSTSAPPRLDQPSNDPVIREQPKSLATVVRSPREEAKLTPFYSRNSYTNWRIFQKFAISERSRKMVIGSPANVVSFWDAKAGQRIWSKELRSADSGAGVHSLAVDPSGKWIAAGTYVGKPFILNASGEEIARLNVPRDGTVALSFSPIKSLLAVAGNDGIVRVFQDQQWTSLPIELDGKSSSSIFKLKFSPSADRLASVGSGGEINVWDPSSRKRTFRKNLDGGNIVSFDFSSDEKKMVFVSTGGTIVVFDLINNREISRKQYEGVISARFYGKDDDIIASSFTELIKIRQIDLSVEKRVSFYGVSAANYAEIEFMRNENIFLIGLDNQIVAVSADEFEQRALYFERGDSDSWAAATNEGYYTTNADPRTMFQLSHPNGSTWRFSATASPSQHMQTLEAYIRKP